MLLSVLAILLVILRLASFQPCAPLSVARSEFQTESLFRCGTGFAKILTVHRSNQTLATLTQVSEGRVLISNAFDSEGLLQDCDIVKKKREVLKFIKQFKNQKAQINRTTFSKEHAEFEKWTTPANIQIQKQRCQMLRRKFRNQNSEAKNHLVRKKRYSSLTLVPGTNYCGAGNRAEYAYDLGAHSALDFCCLEHDGCPYSIAGMTRKYNYFNYRLFRMSYCDCDRKFRDCLKATSGRTAHIIGKLFFNVLNGRCFDLKRRNVCTETDWWGNCKQWRVDLVAKVKKHATF